jgi:dTMP kinase
MSIPAERGDRAAEERARRAVATVPGLLGRFVTFEGIEGTGKSTQLVRLARRWTELGADVVATREPGGTELGRRLRGLLLRPAERPPCPEAELLAYVADRAQHLVEVIEPALARGAIVLCDRYADATLAYQGYGRGMDLRWIRELHRRPPLDRVPDRTVLLDLDPETALERARRRDFERASGEGRFEQESLDFHRRVREGYLDLAAAAPQRIRLVDAAGDEDAVARRVVLALDDLLPPPEQSPC